MTMARLIDGKEIAANIRTEVAAGIQDLTASGRPAPLIVAVEVGHDDVADVFDRVAEARQLRRGALRRVEHRAGQGAERRRHPGRIGDVPGAEAGVDQHEAVARGLDHQDVADQRAGRQPRRAAHQFAGARAHRPAVEVVDRTGHGRAGGGRYGVIASM